MDQDSATTLIRSGITTINSLNYTKIYDITSTPQIYLLDKNKTILYKQLKSEQLETMMNDFLGEEGDTGDVGTDEGAVIEENDDAPKMTDKQPEKKRKSKSKEALKKSKETKKG
jgi:hypothetical protein